MKLTKFECFFIPSLFLLCISTAIVSLCFPNSFILNDSDNLRWPHTEYVWWTISFVFSLVNICAMFLASKKKKFNFILNGCVSVALGFVAIAYKNLLNAILDLCPYPIVSIIGFVNWKKHSAKTGSTIVQPSLSWWKRLILFGAAIILTAILSYVISLPEYQVVMNGKIIVGPLWLKWIRYICDAASLIMGTIAVILMMLRYKETWFLFLAVDFISLTLWAVSKNPQMCSNSVSVLSIEIFAVYQWFKQNARKC